MLWKIDRMHTRCLLIALRERFITLQWIVWRCLHQKRWNFHDAANFIAHLFTLAIASTRTCSENWRRPAMFSCKPFFWFTGMNLFMTICCEATFIDINNPSETDGATCFVLWVKEMKRTCKVCGQTRFVLQYLKESCFSFNVLGDL